MQDLHMMLIPGKNLFIGQCDERTLLRHAGNLLFEGDEKDQERRHAGVSSSSVPSLSVFCETKQAASDGDLFLYGAAIISHRISLSRGVMMCEANDAEMSEEAYSFDLPPGTLFYYCSAMKSRCASRGLVHLIFAGADCEIPLSGSNLW
jgi:hypothetical protein